MMRRPEILRRVAARSPKSVRVALLLVGVATMYLPSSPVSGPRSVASEPESVTFSNQVVRLFQQHCQECHRSGDIAPFSVTSYEDAYQRREKILEATQKRFMPPWKAAPGAGEFVGVRRLAEAEMDLIARWVRDGAPEGDRRHLPAPRVFPDGWLLGTPDVVLSPAEAFEVAPGSKDVYRCFVIPTGFDEDRYITAVEYRPGNRKIVHHVITWIDTTGRAEALDAAEPDPGYTCFGGPGFIPRGGLSGWAPGARPQVMPPEVGMLLPKGGSVVVQVHYHHRGSQAETDRTSLGVYFAKGPIQKRVRSIPVANRGFVIPAGASRHEVTASYTLPSTSHVHAFAIWPHMHLLGREMRATAILPDGSGRPLIYIDDWDFHWQGPYEFARPIALPGGTRIEVRAIYDNSAGNPRNPNRPPRDVGWGEGTTDEMCIAFLRVTVDAERLQHAAPTSGR